MRVKCTVELVNITANSRGAGKKGKGVNSTLSIARKPGDVYFLLWCTNQQRHGVKYKVKENIEQMFSKFLSEGKATIRLKNPHFDLCISRANPDDLKRLLMAVKMAHGGENLLGKGVLSSLAPVHKSVIEKPKTTLAISCRNDYPLTKGFTSTTERLIVNNCSLSRFDTRMLKLKHLTYLNLNGNKIKSIPDAISTQGLVELHLENNMLQEIPASLCSSDSKLCQTLKVLNVHSNFIRILPPSFCNLCQLVQLQIANNQLLYLPKDIDKLRNLRTLFAFSNEIKILPGSVTMLRFDLIDISKNKFIEPGVAFNELKSVPDLEDLVARCIKKHKICYSKEDLPHTCIDFLDKGTRCLCGNFCFRSKYRVVTKMDFSLFSDTMVHVDCHWGRFAPVDLSVCSKSCLLTATS